jgi:hypothetical protein
MSVHLPPIQGVTVSPNLEFKHRVAWYALWIKTHPHQQLHFFHEALQTGFISEPVNQAPTFHPSQIRLP